MTDSGKISIELAARLIMISPRHLQRLVKDGWVSTPYTTVGVVQGYVKSLKDENRRNTATASRNRLDEIRAEHAALKLSILKGDTITVVEAMDAVDQIFGIMKAEILGLPKQFTRDHSQLVKIEALVDDLLRRTAERIAEAASGATVEEVIAED